MKNIVISVVVPVYNEEAVIYESYSRLKVVMEGLDEPYELIFVNDGSRDATTGIIRSICETDTNVRLIDFARNFGHQTAITAGMDYSSCDAPPLSSSVSVGRMFLVMTRNSSKTTAIRLSRFSTRRHSTHGWPGLQLHSTHGWPGLQLHRAPETHSAAISARCSAFA